MNLAGRSDGVGGGLHRPSEEYLFLSSARTPTVGEVCGIESTRYKSSTGPVCGVSAFDYNTASAAVCGVESFKGGRGEVCLHTP